MTRLGKIAGKMQDPEKKKTDRKMRRWRTVKEVEEIERRGFGKVGKGEKGR